MASSLVPILPVHVCKCIESMKIEFQIASMNLDELHRFVSTPTRAQYVICNSIHVLWTSILANAIMRDNLAMVKWLHQTQPSYVLQTASDMAAECGRCKIVAYLYETDLPRVSFVSLCRAAENGYLSVLQTVYVHDEDMFGDNLLYCALFNEREQTARWLLQTFGALIDLEFVTEYAASAYPSMLPVLLEFKP